MSSAHAHSTFTCWDIERPKKQAAHEWPRPATGSGNWQAALEKPSPATGSGNWQAALEKPRPATGSGNRQAAHEWQHQAEHLQGRRPPMHPPGSGCQAASKRPTHVCHVTRSRCAQRTQRAQQPPILSSHCMAASALQQPALRQPTVPDGTKSQHSVLTA
jgi:hypothetical protein